MEVGVGQRDEAERDAVYANDEFPVDFECFHALVPLRK